jgi:hypothetical protein
MKEWLQDELVLARALHGRRRPVRSADVAAGRWRLDVRRRQRWGAAAWVEQAAERAGGEPSAVAVHVVGAERWMVVMTLDAWRDLARRAGDLE